MQDAILVDVTTRAWAPMHGACPHVLFERYADAAPGAPAIIHEGRTLSYGELNARAECVASYLASVGVTAESIVGVCMEPSAEMIVGMLGVLKAGCAFAPTDPRAPVARLAHVLRDADARIVLTQARLQGALAACGATLVDLDADWHQISRLAHARARRRPSLESAAYCIYTSGSTGTPKGVLVTARSVTNLIEDWNRRYPTRANERFSFWTAFPFDTSIFEWLLPLASGAAVVIPTEDTRLDAEQFLRWCEANAVTTAYFPPHIARSLPELAQRGCSIPSRVLVGVEPLDERALCRALAGSGTTLVNGYGPTETTVYSTLYTERLSERERAVPIGRPIGNTAIHILDEKLRTIAAGAAGEIHIGGAGLARGYLKRPALTAERFVPDPLGLPGARMYRTGDRGRVLPDGNIEFIGRRDGQVKVRGIRVELGEIEFALRLHPDVREAVVLAREDVPGEKRLVAYVVGASGREPTSMQLREHLERELPAYMVPSAFVLLEALPLTPGQKVDRRALPAPDGASRAVYAAPGTELERALARIWESVLRVERIGAADHFFALGGDSLKAMRVVSQVRQALHVDVPLRAFFEAPRLADLARCIEADRREGRSQPELTAQPRGAVVRQSFAQERLWFLEQLGIVGPAYHLPVLLRLEGALDVEALDQSLGELVRRHESLRTRFGTEGGEGVQIIDEPEPSFALVLEDASSLSPPHREQRTRTWQQEEARRPFDLRRGPLFRAHLLKLTRDEHLLLLTMHHIVTDGWSVGILLRELGASYDARKRGERSPLATRAVEYADYSLWQREWLRGEVLERQLAYWKTTLKDAPALELPTDRSRPAEQSFRGGLAPFTLSERLTKRLTDLGRAQGATLFMVLLSGIQTLLSRWSGQSDIVVGTPTAGRTHPSTEELVGFFVNMLPMRTDLSGSPSFLQVIERVKATALGAYAHQDVPFDKVVEALQPQRELSRHPVFQVNFTLQNASIEPPQMSGLGVRLQETSDHVTAQYDLSFLIQPAGGGLRGHVEYAGDLFDQTTVERICDRLVRLLEEAVESPELPITKLALVGASERERVLVEWNRTEREYPEACVNALFAEQARRAPHAVALEQHEEQLDYGELERRSNQLARHLVALGVGPEVVVGLCVRRSLEMVTAILGILKAGGAYLPLDPSNPPERLGFMMRDARAAVLVTESTLEDCLPAHWARVVNLDEDEAQIRRHAPDALEEVAVPDNLAYVMYTSGSTGTPKGVGVTHRNIVRLIEPADVTSRDVVLQLAPLPFDASTYEIWGALLHGAKLVLAPHEADLSQVPDLVQERSVTVLWLTAGLFQQMVDLYLPKLSGVRTLLAGGDALSVPHVSRVLSELNGCRMVNGYGPTECTTFSTLCEVRELDARATNVPIGKPLPNGQVYVLDAERNVAPIGVAGELFIGGAGVSRGYIGRGGLTAERFVPHPTKAGERVYRTGDRVRWNEAGQLEFIGRADGQVKVRGYRIELGEIEAALCAHPAVARAVVVARAEGPGEKRLVGYIVSAEGETPTSTQLRDYLRQHLPEYMVPPTIMSLAELPLTQNGKVDRRALPAPEARSEAVVFEAPRTDLEASLARIWADVLRLEQVGIQDDFFDVGGDSIRALQVQAEGRKRGLDFSLRDLFTLKRIAPLAAVTRRGASLEASVAPFSLLGDADRAEVQEAGYEDAYPLSRLQTGLVFHGLWERGTATYHDVISHKVHASLSEPALVATLQAAVDRHPMLRTTIHLDAYTEPLQCVHRHAAVSLQKNEWSHLSEAEQERRLRAWMQHESHTDFDLARGPLIKFCACRLGPSAFQLLVSVHHAVIDGWSVAALCTEIYEDYLQRLEGRPVRERAPLRMHYRDFIAQEQRAVADVDHREYWKGIVTRLDRAPLWRLDRPADVLLGAGFPDGGSASETLKSPIPSGLARRVAEFAQAAGVPVKSVMFAAHLNALRAFMGGREVNTGLVMHSRPEGLDAEKVIGLFLNTVPICFRSEGGTWQDLALRANELEQDALVHRTYPTVEAYRLQGGKELLDVIFNFVNFHVAHPLADRLRIEEAEGVFETNFPLSVSVELDVRSGAGGTVGFCYQTSRFSRDQMQALQSSYMSCLRAMVEHPLSAYERHALLSENDRVLLDGWNATQREYSWVSLHASIAEQAARTPGAIALKQGERQLTYAELERRSNQLARHLAACGVGPEVLVGIFMERSIEMVAALYATLKAGGAYVPLDPDLPAERIAFMAQDSRVRVVLTQQHLLARLPAEAAPVICVDTEWPLIAAASDEEFDGGGGSESLAYVIYTSGSTGKPKAAMNTHRAICNRLSWMQETYRLGPSDRVLQKTPFGFDVSVWELFWPLLVGARLVLARPEGHKDAAYLAALIAEEEITTLHFVPSMLQVFLQAADLDACRTLERVFSSGEALSFELQQRFFQRLSCRLHNLYGPTEAAVDVTFWECNPKDGRRVVPIGRPVANTQIHVLDARLERVPVGVAGELHIGGVQVGRGYYSRAKLTAERFVPDPFSAEAGARLYKTGDLARYLPDGTVEYLGRLDHQVKLRGFRIELGEIEEALATHAGVQEAVVLAREDKPGDPRLVAYVVPDRVHAAPVRRLLRMEKEGQLAHHSLYELPNGMAIVHKNKGETDFTYREVFADQTYLKHGITLGRGSCVFDVGANIGLFSLFVGQACDNAEIYAFEPMPAIFEVLRMNAHLYGLNATLCQYGLASEAGSDVFTYYPHVSVVSGRFADADDDKEVVKAFVLNQPQALESAPVVDEVVKERLKGQRIRCQLRTVSDVIAEHGIGCIDLLKLDVEKSESDVLAGIRDEDWPKIRQIVVEVHDIDGRLAQLTTLLQRRGYRLTVEQDAMLRLTGLYTVYAVREGATLEGGEAGRGLPRESTWNGPEQLVAELRQRLGAALPEYMVPSAVVLLDELPLTPNGKIDRRALPAPELRTPRVAYEPPLTDVQIALARIWTQVLSVERVGLRDNFFDLGGHSLLATSVMAKIRSQMGVDVELRMLFDAPILQDLALRISAIGAPLYGGSERNEMDAGELDEGVI